MQALELLAFDRRLEGEVEVTHEGKVIETTTAGGLLGELSLLDNLPHSSTCTATASSGHGGCTHGTSCC